MTADDLLKLDDHRLNLIVEAVQALIAARAKLAALELDGDDPAANAAPKPNGSSKPNGARRPGRGGHAQADLAPALSAFEAGPLSVSALARRLGIARGTARRRIERLLAEQRVVKRRGGDYGLARPNGPANPPSPL